MNKKYLIFFIFFTSFLVLNLSFQKTTYALNSDGTATDILDILDIDDTWTVTEIFLDINNEVVAVYVNGESVDFEFDVYVTYEVLPVEEPQSRIQRQRVTRTNIMTHNNIEFTGSVTAWAFIGGTGTLAFDSLYEFNGSASNHRFAGVADSSVTPQIIHGRFMYNNDAAREVVQPWFFFTP